MPEVQEEAGGSEPQAESSAQETGAPGMVMGMLNRLFGQAGAAEAATADEAATSQAAADSNLDMPHHPLSPSPQPNDPFGDPPEVAAGSGPSATATSNRSPTADTPNPILDREIYRAARNRGELVELPWDLGHHHVSVPYALLGVGATEEPLLFCHAKEAIGDFGMIHMRRVSGGPVVMENGVCYHPVPPGPADEVEAHCGHILRTCLDLPSNEHDLD